MGFWSFLFGKPRDYSGNDTGYSRSSVAASSRGGIQRSRSSKPSVMNLRVGDIVAYDSLDYEVKHRYVYDDHGFKWYAYHLVDVISGDKVWLAVEDDDELEIGLYKPANVNLPDVIKEEISCDGDTFYQDEHGYATVFIESIGSEPRHAKVEYWDFYNEDDSRFLSIERWGSETEASLGKPIEEYELTIYPGDGDA